MTTAGFKKWALIIALLLLLQTSRLRAQGIISGYDASAPGSYSSAFGVSPTASGFGSTAFGVVTTATNNGATAFGIHTQADGYGSTASGGYTLASEYLSAAWGSYTSSRGPESTAFGVGSSASGYGATAFGANTAAIGDWSTAFGDAAEAYGVASVAGNEGHAWGYLSVAFGYVSLASGTASTALGWGSEATGNYSTASGNYALANSLDSFAIGKWNIGGGYPLNWVSTDPLFEIGNGGISANSDALVVYKNGNTVITGTDNELPNQVLIGSHSILTESLADARYLTESVGDGRYIQDGGNGGSTNIGIGNSSPSTLFEVGDGGSGKSVIDSSESDGTQFQIGNPDSNGEASMSFISGVSAFGDSPASENGYNNFWGVGAGVWGIGGSKFAIGNAGYGGPILTLEPSGYVGIDTTSPGYPLEVNGNAKIDGNYIYVSSGGGAFYGDSTDMAVNMPSGGSFYMANVGTDGTRVSQSNGTLRVGGPAQGSANLYVYGSAGINTTTPSAPLDVNGNAIVSGTETVVGGIVVSGSSSIVLIPQAGDLSMGPFTSGTIP